MDLAQKPVYKLDLAAGTSVVNLTTPLVEGDDRAQTFTLELTDKGAPANLDGYSVTAYFGRGKTAEAEADTIPLSGTVSGNVATITLTESCYSRSCYFSMPIRLSNGATGQKRTYLIVRGTVVKSVDGTIIDPDGSVPSLDDLFAQIAVMERSRQAAEEATEEALAAAARADEARAGIQDDLATLTEDIDRNTAPPIIPTATGEIVTISDSANRPLAGLRLYGKTTQDGTPTPSAPVPLVNVGAGGSIGVKAMGKNLLNYDAWKTVGLQRGNAVWENNGVTMTATGDDCYTNDGLFVDDYPAKIPVVPGESITLSWEADRSYFGNIYIFPNGGTDGAVTCNNNENRPLVYTADEGVSYVTIRFSATKAGDVISYRNIMVERGSSATAFEPYKDGGSLIASTPNGLAGVPADGGAICDYKNYGAGVHIQHVGVLTLNGTENWEAGTTFDGRNNRYMLHVPDKMPELSNDKPSRVLCNAYPTISPNAGYLGTEDYGVQGQNDTQTIIINDARYLNQDLNGFKASLAANPITVLYVLVTPIITPIPDDELAAYRAMKTHKPNTTVYNDAGAVMQVDYIADTKNYIDQKLATIAAATI